MEVYAKCGTVLKASIASGVNRESVRRWDTDDVLGFSERYSAGRQAFQEYGEQIAPDRIEASKWDPRFRRAAIGYA